MEKILMGHGSGSGMTRKLIEDIFVSKLSVESLDDGVEIENRVIVTTDAHVIRPLFYPGGDIGKLAVSGTVNDLAMMGAVPKYLLMTYIIEEGFSIDDLRKIVDSVNKTSVEAGVKIIAGDTKVVEYGKGDGVYITSTGIGELPEGVNLSSKKIKSGDKIIVNGNLGDHTVAIINVREKLGLNPEPESDCAPLNHLVQRMLKSGKVRYLRDATRGGVATVLNEIVEEIGLGIIIEETSLPISEITESIGEMLGLDPLYMANEGKLVAFTGGNEEVLISEMKKDRYGKNSHVIGRVTDEVKGVYMRTEIGSLRPIMMLESDPLPRIC